MKKNVLKKFAAAALAAATVMSSMSVMAFAMIRERQQTQVVLQLRSMRVPVKVMKGLKRIMEQNKV